MLTILLGYKDFRLQGQFDLDVREEGGLDANQILLVVKSHVNTFAHFRPLEPKMLVPCHCDTILLQQILIAQLCVQDAVIWLLPVDALAVLSDNRCIIIHSKINI